MTMKKYLFIIGKRTSQPYKSEICVIASESAIRRRMYIDGQIQFLSSCYDDATNYEGKDTCEGLPILNLEQFDDWLINLTLNEYATQNQFNPCATR